MQCVGIPLVLDELIVLLLMKINDFKDSLNRAKEITNGLPGGELLLEEQDDIIAMLEGMRDRKRYGCLVSAFLGTQESLAEHN